MPDTLCLAGALVPPHEHPGAGLAVQESGVGAVDVASVLNFGPGFDVTEGPSGQANVALDLTESVWTFAQGGFQFRDGSGPLLSTRASGDILDLTGKLDVSSIARIGSLADAADNYGTRMALRVAHETGDCSVFLWGAGLDVRPIFNTTTVGFAYGVCGEIQHTGTANGSYVAGLMFNSLQSGSGSLAWLHGVLVTLISYAGTGAITTSKGLEVDTNYQGPKPTTFYGVHVLSHADMNTVYGVRVEDFTGATIRLLEIGPSTPYLRVLGGANPAANQTNLYLAEGVTPTLRRVQWKAGNTLGAGDRVMVLV
jgi:hypothetical protein